MFKHYLTTALRHFKRHKATTAINVACLAAGLLCFLFSLGVINSLEGSDRQHANAALTYVVTTELSHGNGEQIFPTVPNSSLAVAKLLQAGAAEELTTVRASIFGQETSLAAGERKLAIRASFVDPQFTTLFDLDFLAGNARQSLAAPNSVVLTADLARQLFDTVDVIGKTLLVDGAQTVTVTGVIDAPSQPSHMSSTDTNASLYFEALLPFAMHESAIRAREPADIAAIRLNRPMGYTWYHTYVLLPNAEAKSAIDARLASIAKDYSSSDLRLTLSTQHVSAIRTLRLNQLIGTARTGVSVSKLLLVLGGLIVLVASLNYANLAAAQALTRRKEMAVRRAVGAGRRDIILQHLFEAVLITATALSAMLITAALVRPIGSGGLRTVVDILLFGADSLSFWAIVVTIVFAVSAVAGLFPAMGLVRMQPASVLKGDRATRRKNWSANLLVGGQFFAASFLLIAVFIISGQNNLLYRSSSGAYTDPIVAIATNTKTAGVDLERLRIELAKHPEVQAVSATMFPMGIAPNDSAEVYESPDASARRLGVTVQLIDYDFFKTLDIKARAGRVFSRDFGDDVSDAALPRAGNVVIDMAFARRLGYTDPVHAIGKTLYVPGLANGVGAQTKPSHIVGVVADKALFAIRFGSDGIIYQLAPKLTAYPLIRILSSDLRGGLAAVQASWDRVAPGLALRSSLLDEQFDRGLTVFRMVAGIFSLLTMFAIAIATIGLIGMAAHIANRRRHEIGVRKTLGASASRILRMLMTDFAKPIVIANLLAWPLAFAVSRAYLNLFVQRIELTATPFVLSFVVTLIVVWIAVAAPSIRAARVNPASVLRNE